MPPAIPRLGISAVYRPAGDGDEVGGDFYDVFKVGEHEWMVVIGDVAGKGIPAATVTAYVRHTVRDLAMEVADPADLLRGLDHGLRAEVTDRFCTIVVLRLCDVDGSWQVTGAVGGHPLPAARPARRRRGRARRARLAGGGARRARRTRPSRTSWSTTSSSSLYTDGVTEARHGDTMLGVDALMGLVARTASDPARVTEAVLAAALDYQDDDTSDDIAVLTLHPAARSTRPPGGDGGS